MSEKKEDVRLQSVALKSREAMNDVNTHQPEHYDHWQRRGAHGASWFCGSNNHLVAVGALFWLLGVCVSCYTFLFQGTALTR